MSFYSNLAETAARLLARYGQDVMVIRTDVEDYDTSTSASALLEIGQRVKGAPFDVAPGVREIQGNLVEADDKTLLLEAAAAPKTKDSVRVPADGGQTYSILSVKTLAPGGEAVIYEAHIRK